MNKLSIKKILPWVLAVLILIAGSVCWFSAKGDAAPANTYSSSSNDENAVVADNETLSLSGIEVSKTGDSSSEEADFEGTNAAVLAKNGATLTIDKASITTNGRYANGVFSTGEGTTLNITESTIKTSADNSGGIMTTGGATMNAENLTVETDGNSSAAIRSDRGGGTVTVNKGTYTSNGTGSPAIYSTADITVNDATLASNDSEAVVIEGGNSVNLKNVTATGNNKTLNGQSQVNTNVMIYQSMSGDASEGKSSFTMNGGEMTSKKGTMFYVTNTTTEINLSDVDFESSDENFLIAAAGPWGNEGSNGGNVTLNANDQEIEGNITVDEESTLNLVLSNDSEFEGQLVSEGETYVELADGCTWKLTGDSTITSLTCKAGAIDLNGYSLTVNGKTYTSGASEGTAIEQKVSSGEKANGSAPPEKPDGENMEQGGEPPEMPQGGNPPSGEPPEKPENNNNQ